MRRHIVRACIWLLKRLGHKLLAVSPDTVRIGAALAPLVRQIDSAPQGGEWKRHQVYAKGLDLFPDHDKDEVGYALELAVRRFKGKISWL